MATHSVRTKDNKTIIDIEAMRDDIRCTVDIEQYTRFLLGLNPIDYFEWMAEVDTIDEIRGYYHENNKEGLSPDELAEKWCKMLANKWKLGYCVD